MGAFITKHVHVSVGGKAACGQPDMKANALYRHQVTCAKCKETLAYKELKVLHSASKNVGMGRKPW